MTTLLPVTAIFYGVVLLFSLPIDPPESFKAGKEISIDQPIDDDLYLAGSEIYVNAPVNGDLVLAGGEIIVRDSVAQDLVVAGGDITINGAVGDDIRVAGADITLGVDVQDDVIVFAGNLNTTSTSTIRGDLIVFGGEVYLNGTLDGELKVFGGEITLNGLVNGNVSLRGGKVTFEGAVKGSTTIAADEIEIGPRAKFSGDVAYWQKDGEMDFGTSLSGVTATLNPGLKPAKEVKWWYFGFAAAIFWLLYVVGAFLMILVLNALFGKYFQLAVTYLREALVKSFGYGMLYILGAPVVIALMLIIVVGIPIGLFLLFGYLFSIWFGTAIASLALTYYLHQFYFPQWNKVLIVWMALVAFVILKVISLIPILGTVFIVLLVASVYGGLMQLIIRVNRPSPAPQL